MSRIRKAVLPIALTMTMVITGSVIYGGITHKQRADKREAKVQSVMSRLKACPDRFRLSKECHSPQELDRLETEAEQLRMQGKYEEAGMRYVDLMGEPHMESKAREMADKCAENGNPEGKKRLLEKLSIKMDAVKRVTSGEQ